MAVSPFPTTIEEFQARVDAASTGGATADDQSRTWDGRILSSREAVLAFVTELAQARNEGRDLGPESAR